MAICEKLLKYANMEGGFLQSHSHIYVTGFWKTVPNLTLLFQYIYHCHMNSIAFSIIFYSTTWNSKLKLLKMQEIPR